MDIKNLNFGTLKEDIDVDNYNYSPESKLCYFCNEKYDRGYITYLYNSNLKTHSCFLCNSVINFNYLSLGKCFLIFSELSQVEINERTLNFFNQNSFLPNLKLLDPNAKLIKMSIYLFMKSFDIMNNNEKKKFANIKIAFTGEACNNLESKSKNYKNYFEDIEISNTSDKKKLDNVKYDLSYLEFDQYVFTTEQSQILNNKINQLRQQDNDNFLHTIQNNLASKQKNTETLISLVNNLIN